MTWDIRIKERVTNLKRKRNLMEGQLKRCEVMATRYAYMLKIENINILLQDMHVAVYYNNGNKHKATF